MFDADRADRILRHFVTTHPIDPVRAWRPVGTVRAGHPVGTVRAVGAVRPIRAGQTRKSSGTDRHIKRRKWA